MANQHWLMKSEPDQFGVADLARVGIEPWTGVRSYFARAHMRTMEVGDAVLFHHSNATPPGVAGLARVVRTGVVDETQFDPDSKYYDPKATREQPIWDCVEVAYVATLPHFVSMDRLRAEPSLARMLVLQRGMRLSVQPVSEAHYETIVRLGNTEPPPSPARPVKARAAKPAKPTKPAKPKPASRKAKPARPARAAGRTTPRTKPRSSKPGTAARTRSPASRAAKRR